MVVMPPAVTPRKSTARLSFASNLSNSGHHVSNARGGDITISQKGQVKTDPAMSPGFFNYEGGQKGERS